MADRRQLLEALIGSEQHSFSLVQAILLQQCAAHDELRSADSLQVVRPIAEEPEGPRRLSLGQGSLDQRPVQSHGQIGDFPGHGTRGGPGAGAALAEAGLPAPPVTSPVVSAGTSQNAAEMPAAGGRQAAAGGRGGRRYGGASA